MFIQIAPMEGVVDWVVRDLITRIGGVDRTVTEFVRVTNQLLPEKTFYKYSPELLNSQGHTKSGVPVYIQLLGSDLNCLAENAQLAVELGAPGIDLNFGCPAKTVNRHDGGATLLKNPERLFQVTSAVKKAVGHRVPVTTKVRLGFEDKTLCKDIAQAVDTAGADQLVVHARTRNEGYKPPAHWEYIAMMKDVVKLPVVANGDIWTLEDYKRCCEVSGLKDVALGRSLLARPDLALMIRSCIASTDVAPMTWGEIYKSFLEPMFDVYCMQSLPLAVGRLKQSLKALSRNFPEALVLFENLKRETNGEVMKLKLKENTYGSSENLHH